MNHDHDASPAAGRPRSRPAGTLPAALVAACALLLSPAAAYAQATPVPTAAPAAASSPDAGGSPPAAAAAPGAKASAAPDPQTSCPPGEHYVKAYTTRRGHLVPANCKKDEPKD